MKLTKEEISAIADRLDEILGSNFHDAIYSTLETLYDIDEYPEISDEDIRKIKEELKRTL